MIGVINSIRRRRDPKAIEPLGKLIHGEDAAVAGAAALAAGEISGPVAAKMLLQRARHGQGRPCARMLPPALCCAPTG